MESACIFTFIGFAISLEYVPAILNGFFKFYKIYFRLGYNLTISSLALLRDYILI